MILYSVFVDDHAELSQKAMRKTGSSQRGEQLPDRLLCPLPHTPAPRQQNGHGGMMIHPTEQLHTGNTIQRLKQCRIKANEAKLQSIYILHNRLESRLDLSLGKKFQRANIYRKSIWIIMTHLSSIS